MQNLLLQMAKCEWRIVAHWSPAVGGKAPADTSFGSIKFMLSVVETSGRHYARKTLNSQLFVHVSVTILFSIAHQRIQLVFHFCL
jgi:hypothetical protein